MLQEGDKLPEFTLKAATGDEIKDIHTSDLLGQGKTVLAFYPLAFTGVCTTEVCELRDALKDLENLGARVYGFSTDTPFANREYAKQQNLNFPLLSDPNADVVHKLWDTQEVAGIRDCAKRGYLVLDENGVVTAKWVTDIPKEWIGVAAIKKALEA